MNRFPHHLALTLLLSPVLIPLFPASAQTGGTFSRPRPAAPPPLSGPVVAPRAKGEPEGDKVLHGVSVPDTWDDAGLTSQIRGFEAASGKRVAVVTWFASLYENARMTSWRNNYAPVLRRVQRRGAVSLIKFSTADSNFYSTHRQATLPDITRGVYDAYFQEAANVLRDFGAPVFLSINHEMNGTWYPYSQGFPGSNTTPEQFIEAWRHIAGVLRKAGANNVALVWSPNVPDVGPVPFTRYYPGDEWTDWVGVSFYSGNPIQNLDLIYRAYAAKKPIFITEWATSREKNAYYIGFPGEDKWVEQVFKSLNERYPRVKAISWFQWKKQDGDHLLQRVPAQQQAYARQVQSKRYVEGADRSQTAEDNSRAIVPREAELREVPRVEAPPARPAPRESFKLSVVPRERVMREQ